MATPGPSNAYPPGPGSDFDDAAYEWRRLLAEALGTFFLVLAAVAGPMINVRFGGHVIPLAAQVAAPGLMVGAVILSMGAVSGAHLNPGVSVAFALRGDFPWRRVPLYVLVQLVGAVLATLILVALFGRQGTAGLTLPGPGIGEGPRWSGNSCSASAWSQ
jgi:aquaporin Z